MVNLNVFMLSLTFVFRKNVRSLLSLFGIVFGISQFSFLLFLLESNFDSAFFIFLFFVFLISSSFIILVSFISYMFSCLNDVGVLKSSGCTDENVGFIFAFQGFIFGLLGGVIGVLLSFCLMFVSSFFGLNFDYSSGLSLFIVLLSCLVGFLSGKVSSLWFSGKTIHSFLNDKI